MINLRYHIISITAVFLALGIGLTLGSTFLDRVTVDTLKAQVDTVEAQVNDTRDRNEALSARIDRVEERDDALRAALPERLLDGRLDGVPVLVLSTRGTDEAGVDEVVAALSAAGAGVSGTWWLTDRWTLDDADEVTELGLVLGLETDDVDRLRRNAAIRLSELLLGASQPPPDADAPVVDPEDPNAPVVDAPVVDPPAVADAPAPTEPILVAALEEAGFLDYETLPGATEPEVLLPGTDARFLVVSGTQPGDGAQIFAGVLLDEMASDGPAPVVAGQGEVDLRDGDGPASEDARRTTFVGPIREGELTRERVSTIDDLDIAPGLAALVLAMEDLAVAGVGHYGVAPGASRLLPGPVAEP